MKKYIISFVLLFAGLTSLRLESYPPESYQVRVKTLDRRISLLIEMEHNETLGDLKQKIFKQTNIAPRLQRIIIAGKPREDDYSPASEWAREGEIKLVQRLRPLFAAPRFLQEEAARGEESSFSAANLTAREIAEQEAEQAAQLQAAQEAAQLFLRKQEEAAQRQKESPFVAVPVYPAVRAGGTSQGYLARGARETPEQWEAQPLAQWPEEAVRQAQAVRQARAQAQRQKRSSATKFTVAALIAAATTYVTRRAYQNRKKLLVKEYDLGNLNKFEDKLWLATIIARYGISWRLRALISKNPAAVAKLSDPFLNALAELYYGKKPSQVQMSQFMQRFFPGRK